jgi:thymidine kinase
MLVTKNGIEFPAKEYDSLKEIEALSEGADVVWFDELMLAAVQEPGKQREAFESIRRIRERSMVLVSGLSATSEMEVFSRLMADILAIADEIVTCRADCDFCGAFAAATRSVCLQEKDGKILVGGDEVYRAACPNCWNTYFASLPILH